jgi:outer membrane protein assembly factor BamB
VANPPDLFVIDDLVWIGADGESNRPVNWEDPFTRRQGYDPLTGDVVREITVPKLTSPGHHFRCYRSKATDKFLLLPKRGVEFLDLEEKEHMRHDWLRAPCIYGFMPANGLLYVAPHQCVCYQGVLMSNFNALAPQTRASRQLEREEAHPIRLVKGGKYGKIESDGSTIDPSQDWPMYRHDPRRSGYTDMAVPDQLVEKWTVAFDKDITPPVAANGTVLVAEKNTHSVHALDADTGRRLWRFTAGARIDSPPTIYDHLVLFGSADGWVYCLDLSDGSRVWQFRAAPTDRLIGAFGQIESAWPVHGSVMVQNDVTVDPPRPVVYFSAGRSSYLDGGIYLYGLDPQTGDLLYENRLDGPQPDPFEDVGGAGYMDGAKSDILVSDGADLFLHQERFRSDLKRFPAPMQKREREWGGFREYPTFTERGSNAMRLISSRGFLDDSYNEGTYWAFSQRWPGWDRHMNRVGVWGQLLVFNENTVFGVNVFYDRVRVRRGFFPGEKGYRLFAKPYKPGINENEFKEMDDNWSTYISVRVRAMVLTGTRLFIAGPPDVVPDDDPTAAFEGRLGAHLWLFSASTGEKINEIQHLNSPPVYDGLIAANNRLYLSTLDGTVHCFGE